MNWIDVLVIIPVIMGGFWGWRNGLLRWIITLLGATLGIIVAGRTYQTLSASFDFIDNESFRRVAAYAVIFLLFLMAAWISARIIKGFLNVLLLGWIDNLAGLALGAFVGLMAASALISLLGSLPSLLLQEKLQQSILLEPLIQGTSFVRVLLPIEFDEIVEVYKQARKALPSP